MFTFSRRRFLINTLGGTAAASLIPFLQHRFSFIQSVEASNSSKYLILLNLAGGADSHAFFPYIGQHAGKLVDMRGGIQNGIAVDPQNVIPVNNEIGLNPNFQPMANLHAAGQIKLIQKAGVPDPSGSHNDASNHYSFGARYSTANTGWVARLMNANNFSSYDTYSLGSGNRLDFAGADRTPIIAGRLGWYNFDGNAYDDYGRQNHQTRETMKTLLALRTPRNQTEAKLKESQLLYHDAVARIQQMARVQTGSYPQGWLADNFSDVERIIRSDQANGTGHNKVFYLTFGGFDSHSNQGDVMTQKAGIIANAVNAFATNLRTFDQSVWANTMIVGFGEFSRTLRINGGAGTDHGAGQTMFAIGGSVRGGANAVTGPLPTAAELNDRNDLTVAVDFRNVFGEAISWMGYNPSQVFTEQYDRYNVQLVN